MNPHAECHDRVINHMYATGLILAGISGLQSLDDKVAERLQAALDELDIAIHELRAAATAGPFADSEVRLAPPVVPTPNGHRRLSHVADNAVFAYAMDTQDFYHARDNTLWAQERDGLLLDARSGAPLARRVGNTFHDIATNAPLYREHGHGPTSVMYDD